MPKRLHYHLPSPHQFEWHGTGKSLLEAKLSAIAKAKRSVSMETFIFRASEIGQRFRCALTAAAQRGVRARLLVDTVGSFGLRRDYFDEFLAATARQQFEADLAQQAIRITREALQHDRSWWQRLKQRFAYWLFARFDSELAALKLQVWHGCKERFMRRFRAARVRGRRDQSP